MATAAPLRSLTYWFVRYRHSWLQSLALSVLGPCLYMVVMGKVLGSLIADNPSSTAALGGISYFAFVAPAVVASSAMLTATSEATFPVLTSIQTTRVYDAMLATPLRVIDIVGGHLVWMLLRITVISTFLTLLLVVMGGAESWTVIGVVPAAVLTGAAFCTSLVAFTATQSTDAGVLSWQRFGSTPLLLFSGVFYPVSQLPEGLRWIVELTPLYHGAELCRELSLGTATVPDLLVHGGYLAVLTAAGLVAAERLMRSRLVS